MVFDVFDERLATEKKEGKSWEYSADAGFWAPVEHLVLNQTFHYPERGIFCTQYHLIAGGTTRLFRVWEKYYSKTEISAVLAAAGFSSISFSENFLGKSDFSPECLFFVTAAR